MLVTFDSNILVYAADSEAGERHDVAIELLFRAKHRDAVLSLQVLGEFFNVATRKIGLPKEVASGYVNDWLSVYPAVAPVAATLVRALEASTAHDLQFWDAMLWATADHADCDILLTEDFQDGRKLGRVQFVNPFDPGNRRLVDTILPPV